MDQEWQFRVIVATATGEQVGVVGSCPQLGNWSHKNGLVLSKSSESSDTNVWVGKIHLPADEEVQYRFFVFIIPDTFDSNTTDQRIVKRWETTSVPRVIPVGSMSSHGALVELFGTCNGETSIDRGWLTTETVIQLKFVADPIRVWKKTLRDKTLRVKVTPVGVGICGDPSGLPTSVSATADIEESWDVQEMRSVTRHWPIIEVASVKGNKNEFQQQEQFGQIVDSGTFLIFQMHVLHLESVAFLVDFYAEQPSKEFPEHIGFCYMVQNHFQQTEGTATVPITSPKHQVIGQLQVEYLIVRPMSGVSCDMSVSYARHWKHDWRGLEVGHRGAGSSFKESPRSCAAIRENTIASMEYAVSHGADMLEFDVQLSKDLVPVIYHDFYVAIAMKRKSTSKAVVQDRVLSPVEHDMLQVPVKDLTLEQLQMLKLYHVKETSGDSKFGAIDETDERHQPFPTLRQAFQKIDPHVGFNVEIKWTMKLKDGTYELDHPFELNMYLDTILESIFTDAGSRKIVLSCFHPDVCTMLRLKQNKYPVLFLTQGITKKYSEYYDPRTHSIPMAVSFALTIGLLGIDVHTEDILRDPSQIALVQSKALVLFCWGEDNNDPETIRYLKNLGLHGIIYDKIDIHSVKDAKESIFLLEARDAHQRQLVFEASKSLPANFKTANI